MNIKLIIIIISFTYLHHPGEKEDHGDEKDETSPRRQRVDGPVHDEHPALLGRRLIHSEETGGYKGKRHINHFSMTGRSSGTAHYDVSIQQDATAEFVTSSFKIFLTQTFPRCGATLYNVFKDDVSAIQWCQFCVSLSGSLLNILHLFVSFIQNPKLLQWQTVLTTLVTIGTMSICFE